MARVAVSRPFVGIFYMQVCAVADATDAEILAVCNRDNPSGTFRGWCGVVRDGDHAPVPCADDSARVHLLVEC